MQFNAAICIAALLSAVMAVPNVTPKLLSDASDCRYWSMGRYMFVVDSADDAAINGLPAQPYDIILPSEVLSLLAIDLRASRRIAKVLYGCDNGQAVAYSNPFQKLGICQDRQNAHILIGAPTDKVLEPEVYAHEIDGLQQEGMYLGVKGQTTWGFRFTPGSCFANGTVSTKDYYELKLMGLPESPYDTAGYEVEFEGFLKVERWL
jgi:hypothetical protein